MTPSDHSCEQSLAKLHAFRARRPDLDPVRDSSLAFCSLDEFRAIAWCTLCLAQARNVFPRWIIGLEADEAGQRNAQLRSADAQRLEALNAEARRGATERTVKFNPGVAEAVSTIERKRDEDAEWLEGASKVFPTLKGGG